MKLERTKEIILLIKDFNITKYLLNKKERKLRDLIELKESEIEFYTGQIARDKQRVTDSQSRIIILNREINQLEADIKKLVKVINLYID